MAPELKTTLTPNLQSDLFSLGVIEHQLKSKSVHGRVSLNHESILNTSDLLKKDPKQRRMVKIFAGRMARKSLGSAVRAAQKRRDLTLKTQIQTSSPKKRSRLSVARGAFILLSLCLLMTPKVERSGGITGAIDLRVKSWAEVSINGLPAAYAPFKLANLRPGRYHLRWKSQGVDGGDVVELRGGQLFLLQLGLSAL